MLEEVARGQQFASILGVVPVLRGLKIWRVQKVLRVQKFAEVI